MIDIVGLGGSLAPQSASLAALNVALTGAREYGASVQLFDLPGGTRGWTLASSSNCARSATSSRARRSCSGRHAVTTPEASDVEAQTEPLT